MHIAMDGREALSSHRTGKGQWAWGFLQELKRRDVHLTILTSAHLQTIFRLFQIKPDLYFSPTSFIIPALIGWWIPCAIVVHDLIAFRNEPHAFKARWIERLTLPLALKYAAHIFTVSEVTKRDLLERFPWVEPAKVTVIYAGPSLDTFSLRENTRDDTFTILSVGTLCPRKNQLRLIEAFERFSLSLRERARVRGSEPCLILAGSRGWCDKKIIQKAQSTPGVTWLGHVSDEEYHELLAHASIFALPSLEEGFGLAVLDAMAVGLPVLTSDRGSLKEIAGDAAHFVNPENVESIKKGLERLLTDTVLRDELSERGKKQAEKFSWQRTVDFFLQACNYPSRREGTQGRGST